MRTTIFTQLDDPAAATVHADGRCRSRPTASVRRLNPA